MKIITPAKPEHFFYCVDGSVLCSIHELEKKLRTISNETYHHHVNESKNDFHNWIRDVFQEHELANEILTAKTQAEAAAIVRKHLSKAMHATAEIENAIKSVLNARLKTIAAAQKATKSAAKAAATAIMQKKRPPKKKGKAATKATTRAKRHVAKIVVKVKKLPQKKSLKLQSAQTARNPNRAKHDWAQSAKADLGNRKVNKMTFLRRRSIKKRVHARSKKSGKRTAKTAKRGMNFFTKRFKRLTKKSRKAATHKNGKNQVNRWLNWLRLVPGQ